jgi:hypothetical protein
MLVGPRWPLNRLCERRERLHFEADLRWLKKLQVRGGQSYVEPG